MRFVFALLLMLAACQRVELKVGGPAVTKDEKNRLLMRDFGMWARARGIARPSDPAQMRVLFQRFLQEQIAHRAPGPVWTEIVDDKVTHLVNDGATTQIADPVTEDDDWHQLLVQRAQAEAEAGGDDLARDAILQEVAHRNLAEQAPFTRDNPVSILQGVLGTQIGLTVGQPPVQVASWQGADAETRTISCMFSQVNQIIPNAGVPGQIPAPIRSYGIVQFGTRGWLTSVEVDIGPGCQFAIPASQVLLQVALEDTRNTPVAADIYPTVQMTGMLSTQVTVRTVPITRTKYLDNVTIGTTRQVIVPPFAKKLWVVRNPRATSGYNLSLMDSTLTTLEIFTVAAGADQSQAYILPGDCAEVIFAPLTNDVSAARLVFELEL